MKTITVNFLFNICLFISLIEAQVGISPNLIKPRSRSPFPKKPGVKPARSVADTAEEYWIDNACKYPPKAFFSMFRDACDVKLKAENFAAGICQAFFNSSKNLCKLEGASEDEVQTMLSIHDYQSKMDDDEVCDTLAEMKENNPTLFPKTADFSGKEKWLEMINSLIFSPDTCSEACSSIGNLHPLCFGYMLNYQYIGSLQAALEDDEKGREDDENEEFSDQNDTDKKTPEEKKTDTNLKTNKVGYHAPNSAVKIQFGSKDSSRPRRPNPKLIRAKFLDPEQLFLLDAIDDLDGENIDTNPVKLNKTSISFVDILDLDGISLDHLPEDDSEFAFDPDVPIEKLPPEFLMNIGNVPVSRHKLRGYVDRLDRSEEMPMLAVVLAISGILAVVCFFLLFSVRKKIGFYMKHIRQKRRNNWSYERVLAVQPDEDDYYE